MTRTTEAERTRPGEVFAILADPDRRAVLRVLAADGSSLTVAELVDRVGAQRSGAAGPRAPGLHVTLPHQHLPRMADADVVEYERGEGRVALTPAGRRAEEVGKLAAERLGGG